MTTTEDSATDPQTAPGVLIHLDPATLEIGDNVRDNAALDAHFLASVAESGVLVPVTATRAADGTVVIRDGQRRTLAARQANRPTIPVYLLDADESDSVERITHQIVANDHRAQLTEHQRVAGINQLLLAGVSATKVAKRLSVTRTTVAAAKTVAAAPNVLGALAGGQLSLAEAAAGAEFEDDPQMLAELVAAAGTKQFDHTLARLRAQREDQRAYDEAVQRYSAQGYRILDLTPRYGDPSCVELQYLRTADGGPATPDAVTGPAHWAAYISEDEIYLDPDTGEVFTRDQIDWHCEFSAASAPRDGMRDPRSVTEKSVYVAHWYCTDYAAAGLTLCDTFARRVEANARQADTPATAAEGESHDAAGEDARQEQLRNERRKVIALNRLGDAAETVRRTWIRERICSRKTPPKGAARFVAQCLTRDIRLVEEYHGTAIAAELLGLGDSASMNAAARDLADNGDGRAQVITLALVLGALEARTAKDAWRYGDRGPHYCGPVDLLKFLHAGGYELSDVEKIVIGDADPDAVFASLTAQPAEPEQADQSAS